MKTPCTETGSTMITSLFHDHSLGVFFCNNLKAHKTGVFFFKAICKHSGSKDNLSSNEPSKKKKQPANKLLDENSCSWNNLQDIMLAGQTKQIQTFPQVHYLFFFKGSKLHYQHFLLLQHMQDIVQGQKCVYYKQNICHHWGQSGTTVISLNSIQFDLLWTIPNTLSCPAGSDVKVLTSLHSSETDASICACEWDLWFPLL